MTVQTDKYAVGASGTASQKFTFTAPNDGTFKLGRGVLGAESSFPFVVNADDSISGNMGIGAGQTWTAVTGSRAKNVIYTNSTGRSIVVAVSKSNTASVGVELAVDGVVVEQLSAGTASVTGTLSAPIPAGSTYEYRQLSGTATITAWMELR